MVPSSIRLRAALRSLRVAPVLFAGLAPLTLATPAQAGDTPRYEPAPAWVVPTTTLPQVADEAGLVLFDRQFKLEGGELWSFTDYALKVTSPEMLTQVGTLSLVWQPEHGDVIIHALSIVRDGQVIDGLAGGEQFEVIRREAGLEQMSIDGRLTATHQVRGLRIGDTLRLTTSTTERDDVLDGRTDLIAGLMTEPLKIGGGGVRVVWPKGDAVAWKVSGPAATPQPVTAGAYQTLSIDQPLAKLPDAPDALPNRYQPQALIEASTFRDWPEVSALGARLFAPAGLIEDGSDLAARVDAIAAASADPVARAAGALRLVQDEVRYLFNGLDGGNYRPQTPAKTWEVRYGDCKAKTLLLLSVLDRMGIRGEAAFVNTEQADAVVNRLPSFAVFDHVIVRADLGGRTAWLDGTRTGDRQPDLFSAPPFRYALPARATGGALIPIDPSPGARPELDVTVAYDATAGLTLPAPFTATMALRGGTAFQMRAAMTALDEDQTRQAIDGIIGSTLNGAVIAKRSWRFDDEAGALLVEASGVTPLDWSGDAGERDYNFTSAIAGLSLDATRYGDRWGDAPVAVSQRQGSRLVESLRLPATAEPFRLEGATDIDGTVAGLALTRSLTLTDGVATFAEAASPAVWEIAAADLPAERERLAQASAEPPRLVAPATLPSHHAELEAARRSGALTRIRAAYDTRVAEAEADDTEALMARAAFLASNYDYAAAAADAGRAIAIDPDADTLSWRGSLLRPVDPGAAVKTLGEALAMDPANESATFELFELHMDARDLPAAQAVLDRAARTGVAKETVASMRADLMAARGDTAGGLAALTEGTRTKATQPESLNLACWYKGRHTIDLPGALKDCTKAIELGSEPASYLDSRALVYLQMGRPDDALTDLEAGLALAPDMAGSLYLRGLIRQRQGVAGSTEDLAAASAIDPKLPARYARYGVK